MVTFKKSWDYFLIFFISLFLLSCILIRNHPQPIHQINIPKPADKIELTLDLLLTNSYLNTKYNKKTPGDFTDVFLIGENLEIHTIELMKSLFADPIVVKEDNSSEVKTNSRYIMKPEVIYINRVYGNTGWAEGRLTIGVQWSLLNKDGDLIWTETVEGQGRATYARSLTWKRFYNHVLKESLQDLFAKSFTEISSSKLIRGLPNGT